MVDFQGCRSNLERYMSRPLDPLSLQLFVAVCEEGSIARAAARESLVASALSKRVTALEAEVGVPLLLRRRRGVEPTPAGETLLARAREVLGALDRVRAELGAFGQGVQGSVRVLASPSVLAEHLPEEIVRSLREGAADLGVLWDRADLAGLHLVPYRSDHLCIAMAPSHPLARRLALRYVDTLDQVTIGVAPGGLMDQMLRRQAALAGGTPAHRIQVSSMDAACRIVAAGLGLAVLPREVAVPHAGAGRLALVPLAEDWAERRFVIASRPEPLRSASSRLLTEYLRAVAAAI
jgi:DNA-binding transcriptional LysR family regulator